MVEGDGDGDLYTSVVVFCILYEASGRRRTAIEALMLLSQYQFLLTPNLAEQLKCS